MSMFSGKTGRLEVYSVFSYPRKDTDVITLLNEGNESTSVTSYTLFHTESLNFARGIMQRWFNHFSGKFLFFEGDWQHPRLGAPNVGIMFFSDFILIISGLISVLSGKTSKRTRFLLLLLVFAPLPSALSRDQVHAARSMIMTVPLIFLSSVGLISLAINLKTISFKLFRIGGYVLLVFVFFGSLVYFIDSYFVHLPVHNAKFWDYGYKEIALEIISKQDNYNKIVFQQSYEQPFIYFLFYGAQYNIDKYRPENIQKQLTLHESSVGDVGLVENLYNVEFRPFSWPVSEVKGAIIVGDSVSIPDDYDKEKYNLIKEIKYLDSNTAFRIVEIR